MYSTDYMDGLLPASLKLWQSGKQLQTQANQAAQEIYAHIETALRTSFLTKKFL